MPNLHCQKKFGSAACRLLRSQKVLGVSLKKSKRFSLKSKNKFPTTCKKCGDRYNVQVHNCVERVFPRIK